MSHKNPQIFDSRDRSDEYESESSSKPVERTKRKKKTKKKPATFEPEGKTTKTGSPRKKPFKPIGSKEGISKHHNKVETTTDVETAVGTLMNIKVESNDLEFFDRFFCYATAQYSRDIKIFVCNSR